MPDRFSGKRRWYPVACSVQGAKHRRHQCPNQDAYMWWPSERVSNTVIMALADGHGGEQNPRSSEGALLAVETAVQVLADAVEKTNHPETLAQWEETLRGFPRELVASWRTSVLKHVADNPLHGLVPDDANDVHSRVNRDILLAYGTTLLIAVVTPEVLLLLQLGDGDILTVSDHCIVGRPLPSDQRLIANETTSMCASNAADDFRVAAISLLENAPALVMLSTDGYANSFRDDAGFCQVGSDLLKIIRSDGLEAVEANVEEWLNEASEQGSADDVTLGLFWRGNDDEGAS